MMTDHDSVAVTTSMTNVSYSNAGNPSFWSHHNFNGNVRATLNNVADGSLAFVILELDGVQVDTNTFQSLTFANHDLEIAPGTYLLEIQEQYNGTGNYYLTGSTYEQNPVLVQVAVNSGVKAISKSTVNIFPDPATDKVVITSGTIMNHIRVMDTKGVTVMTCEGMTMRAELSVETLAPGMYLVVTDGGAAGKFVKL